MKQKLPNHLSINLDIDTSSLPINFFDRNSGFKIIKGIIISVIIILTAPIMNYFCDDGSNIIIDEIYLESKNESFFYLFPIIGLFFLFVNLATFFQKRKITIDDQNITVDNSSLINSQENFVEPISNYIGISYRTRIFKYGFFVKIHHVIEILHEDNKKTIPIYIGKNIKNIRQRWHEIAKDLKLPAAIRVADGYKILENHKDLQKSMLTRFKEGKINNEFNKEQKIPNIISIKENKEKKKKTLIINKITKESGFFLVASLIIAFLIIITLFLLRLEFFTNYLFLKKVLISFTFIVVVFLSSIMLLRRQGITLDHNKIHLITKLPFLRFKTTSFDKDKISSVNVIYREIEDTYFVAVTSGDKVVHLGKGCEVIDLKWLNSFIINDIINNKT